MSDPPTTSTTNRVSRIITKEEEKITKTIKIELTTVEIDASLTATKTGLKTAMLEAQEKYIQAVKAMVEANHVYLTRLEEWKSSEMVGDSLVSSEKDLA